jgi:diguanylate cyclase (GGDEF)-like protein
MVQTRQNQDMGTNVDKDSNRLTDENIIPDILAADDDPVLRTSLKELLKAYDYDCTLAENGKQTLSLLDEQKFDILLLDLMMPEMDGHQVMEQVKAKFPALDVIVVSGDATFSNAAKALRLGAKDFISKPYKADDLIKSIRHIQETRNLKNKITHMQQKVLTSEQRYRFFINNSPDLIYMLDKKGRFTFINDRIIDFLGYEPEELIGKNFSNIVYDEDLTQVNYIHSQNDQFPDIKQTMEFQLTPKPPEKTLRCFESDTIAINKTISGLISGDQTIEQNVEQIFAGIYGVARDITQKKKYEQQISFQLNYDALTALPNRLLFKDRINYALSQAQRNKSRLAVLYMDMDRFKTINDSLGHPAGDKLLSTMAKRLSGCLRESDTLARIGGDEFLLLMPEIDETSDVEIIIDKMKQVLVKPFHIEGNDIFASFSIGISLFPEDGSNTDTLIKHADMAMYQSKNQQKGSYQFFSNHLVNQFQPNLSIENGIRTAINENQFEIYFQPQFNIHEQKISGVEALIRWNHPEKGMIMPDSFIPIAEETSLICDIGDWVLDKSMQVFQKWNHDSALQHITLAINISALQFAQENFCDLILKTIDKYQLKASKIELEITENIVLQDIQQVVSKFKQLGQHGIRFAIDDFGMGYSSLSYLQELPLNNLKIDRSFLASIQSSTDSNSIISAIVSMAQEMNMAIVAEGVENEIQLNYIRDIGCPIVQGYFFARPMPAEDARILALSQINGGVTH